jgi:hypothetical protein
MKLPLVKVSLLLRIPLGFGLPEVSVCILASKVGKTCTMVLLPASREYPVG